MERYSASDKSWNVEAIGVSTVQKSRHKLAYLMEINMSEVLPLVKGLRVCLVTVRGSVNAIGNSVPLMMFFPRRHFKGNLFDMNFNEFMVAHISLTG